MAENQKSVDKSDEASKHIARTLLYMTAGKSSKAIDSFLMWLFAGSGATFGLVIGNLDKLKPYLLTSNVRSGIALFLSASVLTVVEKYLASLVVASSEAVEAATKFSQETHEQFPNLQMAVVHEEFERATLPTTKFLKGIFYKIFKGNDAARNTAIAAQVQSQIALIAIFLLLLSIGVLAAGLQV